MKKPYTMIGFDTSSTNSGFSIWQNGELCESGSICLKKIKDAECRIEEMCKQLTEILKKYKPGTVAIELMVVDRNPKTQRMLSEIIGFVKGYAYSNGCEVVSYRPGEWRRYVADKNEKIPTKREDCKLWAVNKVQELYGKTVCDDEAEGILVGLARINQINELLERGLAECV